TDTPWYTPSAICCRCSGFFRSCSSEALLRNEISVRIDGMSAPMSTTNGALRTPRFFPVWPFSGLVLQGNPERLRPIPWTRQFSRSAQFSSPDLPGRECPLGTPHFPAPPLPWLRGNPSYSGSTSPLRERHDPDWNSRVWIQTNRPSLHSQC